MSKKSQHNNILLAVIGFTAVVILVGVIGFFTLEQKDDTIQGEVEVSEYRVSCKLPGRVVELRVKEGDYVHVGDTLAILEIPEMKSQEQMLQATSAAAEAMKDLTDAGARKEQIQGAFQLVQQAEAAAGKGANCVSAFGFQERRVCSEESPEGDRSGGSVRRRGKQRLS